VTAQDRLLRVQNEGRCCRRPRARQPRLRESARRARGFVRLARPASWLDDERPVSSQRNECVHALSADLMAGVNTAVFPDACVNSTSADGAAPKSATEVLRPPALSRSRSLQRLRRPGRSCPISTRCSRPRSSTRAPPPTAPSTSCATGVRHIRNSALTRRQPVAVLQRRQQRLRARLGQRPAAEQLQHRPGAPRSSPWRSLPDVRRTARRVRRQDQQRDSQRDRLAGVRRPCLPCAAVCDAQLTRSVNSWEYGLGAEILTPFGRLQNFVAGVTFREL